MHIEVAELQRVANLIFEEMKRAGQSRFELTENYYWDVDDDCRFRAAQAPPPGALTLGDLYDDWEEVQQVGRTMEPVPSHDLRHLAGLLRFVALRTLP